MPNSTSPDLMIGPVKPKDAGFYICRVHCGEAFEFSQWAQVDVLNVAMSYGELLQHIGVVCAFVDIFPLII